MGGERSYRYAITPTYQTFETRHDAIGELAIERRLLPFDYIDPSLVVFEEGDAMAAAIARIQSQQESIKTVVDAIHDDSLGEEDSTSSAVGIIEDLRDVDE